MNRREDYSFGTLLTERYAAADATYKHDLRMALLFAPLGASVAILILAMF